MPNSEAARIIREARQTKECCYFDEEELNIVSTHPTFNSTEKFMWIFLTGESSRNQTSHSCIMTEQQLAQRIGNKLDKVTRAIANLTKEGFLEVRLVENGALAYFPKCPITNVI